MGSMRADETPKRLGSAGYTIPAWNSIGILYASVQDEVRVFLRTILDSLVSFSPNKGRFKAGSKSIGANFPDAGFVTYFGQFLQEILLLIVMDVNIYDVQFLRLPLESNRFVF